MAEDAYIRLLASVPLFEAFSKRDLSRLRTLVREARFNAGEEIITKGTAGSRVYIIVTGRAKVVTRERVLRTVTPGGLFGEMSLLDGQPTSATVRAETDVHTLTLSRTGFLGLLEDNWSLTKKVLASMSTRIRNLSEG